MTGEDLNSLIALSYQFCGSCFLKADSGLLISLKLMGQNTSARPIYMHIDISTHLGRERQESLKAHEDILQGKEKRIWFQ